MKINLLKYHILFLIVFLFSNTIFAENPEVIIKKISNNRHLINSASEIFDVNSAVLSSIIFTERELNYDLADELFDSNLAYMGFNSSMGFCQIKIKTAYFVEVQLNDSLSKLYPGVKYRNILSISSTKDELLKKLNNDSINILYAAAYLRIIQTRWKKAGYPIDERPDIVGTLYNTGLFYKDGNERKPRWNPNSNDFGQLVKNNLYLF